MWEVVLNILKIYYLFVHVRQKSRVCRPNWSEKHNNITLCLLILYSLQEKEIIYSSSYNIRDQASCAILWKTRRLQIFFLRITHYAYLFSQFSITSKHDDSKRTLSWHQKFRFGAPSWYRNIDIPVRRAALDNYSYMRNRTSE